MHGTRNSQSTTSPTAFVDLAGSTNGSRSTVSGAAWQYVNLSSLRGWGKFDQVREGTRIAEVGRAHS